jgi:hypothetical protein
MGSSRAYVPSFPLDQNLENAFQISNFLGVIIWRSSFIHATTFMQDLGGELELMENNERNLANKDEVWKYLKKRKKRKEKKDRQCMIFFKKDKYVKIFDICTNKKFPF